MHWTRQAYDTVINYSFIPNTNLTTTRCNIKELIDLTHQTFLLPQVKNTPLRTVEASCIIIFHKWGLEWAIGLIICCGSFKGRDFIVTF